MTKKELQEISVEKLGYSIAQLEARLILLLPIGISYENWCFLHKIVDGDVDD